MPHSRRVLLTLLAFAIAVLLWLWVNRSRETLQPESEKQTEVAPTGTKEISNTGVSSSVKVPRSASKRAPQNLNTGVNSWKAFQEKFGQDYFADYSDTGRITEIRGKLGKGKKAGPDFKPDDPQKAIARAKEVLDSLKDLMDIQSDLPLDRPLARGNANSVQVFFKQTYGGVPIAPYGNVTVDLGAGGELVGMGSSYLPDIKPANDALLNSDQARTKLLEAMSSAGKDLKATGGNHVLWVPSQSSPHAIHAYEYHVDGQQVIVDASTGDIVFRKDRRQF